MDAIFLPIYRARNNGLYLVGRTLLLLLLACSGWPCLGPAKLCFAYLYYFGLCSATNVIWESQWMTPLRFQNMTLDPSSYEIRRHMYFETILTMNNIIWENSTFRDRYWISRGPWGIWLCSQVEEGIHTGILPSLKGTRKAGDRSQVLR